MRPNDAQVREDLINIRNISPEVTKFQLILFVLLRLALVMLTLLLHRIDCRTKKERKKKELKRDGLVGFQKKIQADILLVSFF